jgi:hypothetical protein
MALSDILATIDIQIAILRQARTLLSGGTVAILKRSPGRLKKSAVVAAPVATKPAKKKRKLTPEGRKRIAEAVKKRWAAQRKAAAK